MFFPLDQVLLNALVLRLPEDRRLIAQDQIAKVSDARTMHYGTASETMMWRQGPFGIPVSDLETFSFPSEEAILATVKFKCRGRRYAADYIVLNNVLFMIKYNKSTKDIMDETDVEIIGIDVDAVLIDQFGLALSD